MPAHRAILGTYLGNGSTPAPVQLSFKPFPWPPFTLDLAATAAASAFNLLIVFAFLNPTRSVVVTIVREKELRLREGMRILGLTVRCLPLSFIKFRVWSCGRACASWASWYRPCPCAN